MFGGWFGVGVWGEMGECGVDCLGMTEKDNIIEGTDILYVRLSL